MELWWKNFEGDKIGPCRVLAVDYNNFYIQHPYYDFALQAIPALLVTAKIELVDEKLDFIDDYIVAHKHTTAVDFSLANIMGVVN